MADVFPVDFTSDVGRVRKYIPDLIELHDPKDFTLEKSFMWSDSAIQSFINDEIPVGVTVAPRTTIWRAAAYIMIATANNENLILKKLVTEDLQTDGPSVAKALIAAAQELLRRADDDDAAANEAEIFIDVPYVISDHTDYPYNNFAPYARGIWGL